MQTRKYAVLWSGREEVVGSGRLELLGDRLELSSRSVLLVVPLGDVTAARIARGAGDRLRGLPVLSLDLGPGGELRIASLEGTGALYEIARLVERSAPVLRASGTKAASVVPAPRADSTSSVPPTSATRSRMPTTPSAS
jgi:hypothetical protein